MVFDSIYNPQPICQIIFVYYVDSLIGEGKNIVKKKNKKKWMTQT